MGRLARTRRTKPKPCSTNHVYREYEKKVQKPVNAPVQVEPVVKSSSFLDMLADIPSLPSSISIAKPPDVTECDRWYRLEGGKGDTYHPLLWWKICVL